MPLVSLRYSQSTITERGNVMIRGGTWAGGGGRVIEGVFRPLSKIRSKSEHVIAIRLLVSRQKTVCINVLHNLLLILLTTKHPLRQSHSLPSTKHLTTNLYSSTRLSTLHTATLTRHPHYILPNAHQHVKHLLKPHIPIISQHSPRCLSPSPI